MKKVLLLTGGKDKPYVFGLTSGIVSSGFHVDLIGSDYMEGAEILEDPRIRFLNYRGDLSAHASFWRKLLRILKFYARLLKEALRSDCKLFHIIWLNKFDFFDRTLLNLFYKLLGKKLVFTAHNVDAGVRDGKSSLANRLSLYFMYHLVNHIIVHTHKMKSQLTSSFRVKEDKVSVIPMGINTEFPDTDLTRSEARERLGLNRDEKVLLFFGYIRPYKGLEYLLEALRTLVDQGERIKLVVAGDVAQSSDYEYWQKQEAYIDTHGLNEHVLKKIGFIRDEEVEVYFKAADLMVLPYKYIYQTGVLFISYAYGLPVLATDVGSLREDIVEGETGYVCRNEDPADMAARIQEHFESELCQRADSSRESIMKFAHDRYSWSRIGETTTALYRRVLGL